MRARRGLVTAGILLVAAMLVGSVAPAATSAAGHWHPRKGTSWQIQYAGTLDVTVKAHVFDLDVDATSAKRVAALQAKGHRVVCYIDVGTWESYRADAAAFPSSVLGKRVNGWPDERWLDARALDALGPILEARFDRCARKGFDAVDPDWINHYEEDTGFPITKAQSIAFAKWVAAAAHARGLGVAQKNAPGLVAALSGTFDFAVTEDCWTYQECGAYRLYLDAGHAVFDIEYIATRSQFCPKTERMGISAIRKHLSLGPWRRVCP